MRSRARTSHSIAIVLFASLALSCASTKVVDREPYQGRRLPRPTRILVYDFAATGADLPEFSEARDRYARPEPSRTPEELAKGRELGSLVRERLVAAIRDMGLPALPATLRTTPGAGDIALVGYFAAIDEGNRLKRLVIGFGTGTAEMTTRVEAYRMTDSGMHPLASSEFQSGGNKMPGVVIPVIVTVATANPIGLIIQGAAKAQGEISGRTTIEGTAERTADAVAEELRKAFEKQGWI